MKLSKPTFDILYQYALRAVHKDWNNLKQAKRKLNPILDELEKSKTNTPPVQDIAVNVLAAETKFDYVKKDVLETSKEETPYKG